MIAAILSMAAPLILAGTGALITELAGSLAIFMEGFMTLGAFVAWTVARATGYAWAGSLAAALLGAFLAWALARFCEKTGANTFIAALALNLAATGITQTLSIAWFGTRGVLVDDRVPASTKILSGIDSYLVLALVAVALTALIVKRTHFGLRLRAAGKDPEALAERGVSPARYREGAWAAAGALAALGGAALTFRIGAHIPGGVAGRGWIALVIVYLGFRNAWGVLAASILFAAAEYLSGIVQGTGTIPATLLLGLPPALSLVLFSITSALRSRSSRH